MGLPEVPVIVVFERVGSRELISFVLGGRRKGAFILIALYEWRLITKSQEGQVFDALAQATSCCLSC